MKKIFYLASIAALAFSSCAKDETTGSVIGTVGGSKIKAAVEADDTRTHLEEVDGKYEFRWSKNDILGVYGDGENSAPNVAFTLLDSSIDQAAGVFESNYKLLEGDNYVAYYPYQPGSKMVPTWTYDAKKNATLDASSIKLSIPASQNYAPASFNTLTAPAISDSFVLDEDGNADVTMQPVADYLFVNMMSTEPIQKLTLKLYDNDQQTWLNIAGEGTLYPYVIKGTEKVRYALGVEGMTETAITLNSGQLTGAVCHEPNVYVFTIPAGILGMNRNIMARIIVNDGVVNTNTEGIYYFDVKGENNTPATQLNGASVTDPTTKKVTNVYREVDWSKTPAVATRRIENTVFWANPMVDTDGDKKVDARGSFVYNPEKAFIIRNEVDFLKYMNEYESDSEECGGKDAFVCSEYEFDFSEENMGKLATQIKEEYLRAYISDYIANGMPCIQMYENDFRGNGATLKAITKLQSWCGLFGIITPEATINNVTFEDIEAAESPVLEELSTRATGNYDQFIFAMSTLLDEGFILGTVVEDNEKGNNINKVTVKNAKGGAVFGGATVAAFNGVAYEGVAGLNSAAALLIQNADLDMTKTWDVVKGVKGNVFGMIKAVEVEDAKGNVDGHHVVTIAKGGDAEYKKLASIIYVAGLQGDTAWLAELYEAMEDEDFDLEALEEFIDYFAQAYYYGDAGYIKDLPALAWEYDDCATSVVIENVSYWTGDYIAPAYDAKAKNYPIAYAEQLAVGLVQNDTKAVSVNTKTEFALQRDINLNYENNNTLWEMAAFGNNAVINGNKKTITGFVMESSDDYLVAPFANAYEIKDLTVNGVDITILTNDSEHISVPKYVAGLVGGAVSGLTNVTVNGINFDAYDISGGFNSMDDPYYATDEQTFIGWVAACSSDAQYTNVKANVTSSKLMGVSGLVAAIELYSVTESHFEGCSLTTGKIAQEALTDFVPVAFNGEMFHNGKKETLINAAGSMVGFVGNGEQVAKSIEFNNSGAPKFVYDAGDVKDNNKINVLYNDKKHTTLLGLENYPAE